MSAFLDALRRDADWWDDILVDLDRDTETFSVTMNRSRARWFAASLRSAAKEIEDLRKQFSDGGEEPTMSDGPNKIEYTFDREQLRMALESTMDADLVEGMNFRIEPIEGGTQRDPELMGVRAVWWRPRTPLKEDRP